MYSQAWHIGGTQTFTELNSPALTDLIFRISRSAWAGRKKMSHFEEQKKLKYREDKWLAQYYF